MLKALCLTRVLQDCEICGKFKSIFRKTLYLIQKISFPKFTTSQSTNRYRQYLTKCNFRLMSNKNESISLSRKLRFLNFIIDFIAIYFLWWLTCYLTLACFENIFGFNFDNAEKGIAEPDYYGKINYEDEINGIVYYIILASTLLVSIFAYYSISEFYFRKTLGKIVTHSRVVTENGGKVTFKRIILRTICRFIPIDWLSFIFSRNGIHDKLSKTKVIRD